MDSLVQAAAAYGLQLGSQQADQFARYQALLLAWNTRVNLTAITEPRQIQTRHFLDALTCATETGDLNGRALIDVGAGAGFPGLPLKILYPQLKLTLVESVGKKTVFLQAVVEALGLTAVSIITARAEELGQQAAHREQYDWAVARAVAELRVLAEYLLPLCRVGGHMLAQKGAHAPAEVTAAANALSLLGGGAPRLAAVDLPGHAQPHYLVVVPKARPTPARYPRRVGMPAKRPL
jgi:16S rRNA (guanine527-N7)-methyltransferase